MDSLQSWQDTIILSVSNYVTCVSNKLEYCRFLPPPPIFVNVKFLTPPTKSMI